MKSELDSIRHQIDEVDQQIFDLIVRRCELAITAAIAKGNNACDTKREQQIISDIRQLATANNLNPNSVEDIFLKILKTAREQQP